MTRTARFDGLRDDANEAGISLVEVIVAIVLVGIISAGAVTFFMAGVATVAEQQHRQVAVTLANSAMDRARSVSPGVINANSPDAVSGIIKGRSEQEVIQVSSSALGVKAEDLADMRLAFDSRAANVTGDEWVQLTEVHRVDSQTFHVTTLIGECYRPKAASEQSVACLPKAAPPTSDLMLYRVRVVVGWQENENAEAQSYRATTLIDPSQDVLWNTVLQPYAYDDNIEVAAGSGVRFYDLLGNDQFTPGNGGNAPAVTTSSNISGLTINPQVINKVSGVNLAPPSDSRRSGVTSFKYNFTENAVSIGPAKVSVTVRPVPRLPQLFVTANKRINLSEKLLDSSVEAGIRSYGLTSFDEVNRTVRVVPVAWSDVDIASSEPDAAMATYRAQSDDALTALGITADADGNIFFESPDSSNTGDVVLYYYLVEENKNRSEIGDRVVSSSPLRLVLKYREPPAAEDITFEFVSKKLNEGVNHQLDFEDHIPDGMKVRLGVKPRNLPYGDLYASSSNNATRIVQGDELDPTGAVYRQSKPWRAHETVYKYVLVDSEGFVSEEKDLTVRILPSTAAITLSLNTGAVRDFELNTYAITGDTSTTLGGFNNNSLSAASGQNCLAITKNNANRLTVPRTSNSTTCVYEFTVTSGQDLTSTFRFSVRNGTIMLSLVEGA